MTAMLRALALAAASLTVASPVQSAPVQSALAPARMQKGLEPGEWLLRARGHDGEVRRLCIADLRQFLQLRHSRNSCRIFTVAETANRHVVTYDCGAAGNGRTDLRIETSRLVQIQSQGIADGAPFSFAVEGRWAGACR